MHAMRRLILLLEDIANTEAFLMRAYSVAELIKRGATPGERAGAVAALERMIERCQEEIDRLRAANRPTDRLDDLLRSLNYIKATAEPPPQAERNTEARPKFTIGDWVVVQDNSVGQITRVLRKTSTNEYYYEVQIADHTDRVAETQVRAATAADRQKSQKPEPEQKRYDKYEPSRLYIIIELAHYTNPAQNSNKVYGITQRTDTYLYYTFWGDYQKPLHLQEQTHTDAYMRFESKIGKGYQLVDANNHPWLRDALDAAFRKLGLPSF